MRREALRKLDASMQLLSEDEKTVIPCDVSVSGTYLKIMVKNVWC